MNEARAIARCEEAAALLPPRFRRAALQMPDHRKRYTEEFRLRAGQPPAALLPEGEVTLPYFGADSRVTPRAGTGAAAAPPPPRSAQWPWLRSCALPLVRQIPHSMRGVDRSCLFA